MENSFDIAIIGAGPAGYNAAAKAARAGKSVVLFEKDQLGGVCLNVGCIPTKALLFSAKVLDYTRNAGKYGVECQEGIAQAAKIFARKSKIVKKLTGAVGLKMSSCGVNVVKAQACLNGKEQGLFRIDAGNQQFYAENVLLCSGSETVIPPIPGLEQGLGSNVITSDMALNLNAVPDQISIIGGGVIGMEFASFFCSMGAKVTVIEMAPQILPGFDSELSDYLQKSYAKKGVVFMTGTKVNAVSTDGISFSTQDNPDGFLATPLSLVCVGRRPNALASGVETLGVEMNRAAVKVGADMQTSVPGLYAAGDVTALSMLAHSAIAQAQVAVDNMCGIKSTMQYNAIPGVVYTNPEIAQIGLTQAKAAELGYDFEVRKLPMTYSGRFQAENEMEMGLCKMVIDRKTNLILGTQMCGNMCSEIISVVGVAIKFGITLAQLQETVFPHPSVTEILKEL